MFLLIILPTHLVAISGNSYYVKLIWISQSQLTSYLNVQVSFSISNILSVYMLFIQSKYSWEKKVIKVDLRTNNICIGTPCVNLSIPVTCKEITTSTVQRGHAWLVFRRKANLNQATSYTEISINSVKQIQYEATEISKHAPSMVPLISSQIIISYFSMHP